MANIFSGLLGGGSNASNLVKYKQEMEEYERKQEAQRQLEAVSNIDPSIKKVLEGMSPERQEHLKLQRRMMMENPLFDKGIEGFNNSIKQRGGTIADMLKQDKSLDIYKKKQLFKIANPTADSVNKKIETAEWYRKQTSENRSLARDSWRDRQFLDLKTKFRNVYSGQDIYKELIKAGVDTARAPIITERLTNFYDDIDATEDFLITFENQRKDIQKLYGMTPNNTGWNAVFNSIPAGDALAWAKLKETIVSNIGLSKIMDLKASSAQGATGLGALNEAELKMLQDHLGNLDQTNDPEEIQRILRRMDGDMQRIVDRKIRNLRQERAWYNRNKTYMNIKAGTPDLILPEQEYMFSKKDYHKPENTSELGAEKVSVEDLLEKWK